MVLAVLVGLKLNNRVYANGFRMGLKYLFPALVIKEPFSLALAKKKNRFLDC